jgi:hypothetical protein
MIIGYARVSTDGQSLEAQQASLEAAGAERIFAEKISGAVTDRKALAQAIKAPGTGDILLVTRLDRLARSTRDLLNILDGISPEYREQVLPESITARVSVEKGSTLGWAQYVGASGHSIGMETFGASAPLKELQKRFGFTPENIVAAAKHQIAKAR